MTMPVKTRLTPEEYLDLERQAEYKSEYLDGDRVPMTGASRKHNLVAGNIFGLLWQQLKGKPCEVYANDMRVRIPQTNRYTYPDVVALCDEPLLEDDHLDTLLNPTLIVEVLSDSTQAYDRSGKFAHYRTLESLKEYLLVSQDEVRLEQYVKQTDGRWLLADARSLDDVVVLTSIPGQLALKDVYDKTNLA